VPKRNVNPTGAKLAALRTAIDEGDASGTAKGKVFDRVRKTLKLGKKPR